MKAAIAIVAGITGLLAGALCGWYAADPAEARVDRRNDPYAHCSENPQQERVEALQEAIRSHQGESP